MKKFLATLLAVLMAFTLVACGNKGDNQEQMQSLETTVEADVNHTVCQLDDEWQTLKTSINTYDKYVEDVEIIENFYNKIYNTFEKACIRLQEFTIEYANLIIDARLKVEGKINAVGDMLECIYTNALQNLYSGIYRELMPDILSAFYSGILLTRPGYIDYSVWQQILSHEYSVWQETSKKIYTVWLDTCEDIYGFYVDIIEEIIADNMSSAREILDNYIEYVEGLL